MLLSDDVIEKWCYSALAHMEIQGAGRGGEGRLPPPPAPQADSGPPGRDSGSPARILGRGRVAEVGKNSPSIRRIFWSFCFCIKYAPISGVFSIRKF